MPVYIRYMRKIFTCIALLLCVLLVQAGQSNGLIEYKLDNGLTVMLWEDHDQPDVQGWTVTRAGSIDEPETATGLAHYLEHMLFKGTDRIGTLDWEKERPLYEHVIALYDTLAMTEDPKSREIIQTRINKVSREEAFYSATDEFPNLIQSIGGEGLNAFIIRSAGFPSMLKTAKHKTHFAFLLVQYVSLCNYIQIYAYFMQSGCIFSYSFAGKKQNTGASADAPVFLL